MKRFLMSTAAIVVAATGSAQAQTQSPGKLETVVVTAERRTEAAQNVGIALSVLTGDDLKRLNVTTVNQLEYATPSLEVVPAFGSGQPEFRLRGVGFDDYASNNSSTVGVYVDEVAYPIQAQTQGLLFDVARVEVLRGPQGTLYGRNTTGGAINFITNKPTDQFSAGLNAEYDSHDEFKSDGFISGPISDTLKFRLAAITDQGGAWQTNRLTGQSLGDKNTSSVRGQLEWDPSASVNFLLEAHVGYDKSEGTGLYLFSPLAYNPALPVIPADTDITHTGWGGSSVFSAFTGIATDAKPFHNTSSEGVNLHGNFDLGFADLTSITSYEHMDRREYDDWDASQYAYAGVYFATNAKVFSQEVRLASKEDGPFQWLAGIYYSNEQLDEAFDSDFWQSLFFVTSTTYTQGVNAVAVFGQIEYQLTDDLKLIGGLRAEDETRKQGNYVTGGLFGPGSPITDFSAPADKSLESKPLSGKAELEYKPSVDSLIYASISKGTKSGGFTAYNVGDSSAVKPIKPEDLWAYEIGFKSSFADDTLRLNGAVFYYDYHNQQVQSAIWSVAGAIGALVNAQKSHLDGGELELQWQPTPELQISQSLGYKDGSFDKFDSDLDIAATQALCVPASICVPPGNTASPVYVNRKGAKVGFPPLSYNGSISYVFDLGDYALTPEFDYAFHDKRTPLLLGPTYNIPSYWIANASVTFAEENGPWQVTVFGHNIFDEKYDLERNFFLTDINIAAPGEPATVGVRVGFRY